MDEELKEALKRGLTVSLETTFEGFTRDLKLTVSFQGEPVASAAIPLEWLKAD